ncbi:MAG: LuxR family transcriptional regulator [Dehalococcoidia bacterium]
MSMQATGDRLDAAREAAERHAWRDAYEILTALDREGRLDGAGLNLLGAIAWWASQPDESTSARERAFAAYMEEGDRINAALMALLAAFDHQSHLSEAIARGWRARAARILADEPESIAHGYLMVLDGREATGRGDLDAAAELGGRAVDIGSRFGEKDLQAYGLVTRGMALVQRGGHEEGLALLDEATAAAVAGELSPYATGIVYCQTISTCRDLADYRRAGQWTEVAERWCERQAISGFPGVCRVHRAEILALRGEWTDAVEQAQRASEELLAFKALPQAAEGFYALGEIRLRIGDLEGADEAFRRAHDLGRDPQPGRALLYLAQGRADTALTSLKRALAPSGKDHLLRAKMLPALVEIALASGDLETARATAEELSTIAATYGSPALHAAAHCARGVLHIASNEPDEALHELTQARAHWQAVDVPYELARTRMAMAMALRLCGEADEAAIELDAAHSTFARLGAALDAARCEHILEELRRRGTQGERQRRAFMFTDIVGSTELISVIGDEAWGDLVRWHDEALRRLASAHGGEEINHAGDGFFFAFQDVRSAVTAAVGIQRALAAHRRNAGFAPRVRIGLHAAEATRVDESYLGQGVHEAARIGALAGANEIVASADSLDGLALDGLGEPRSVELKGIPGPVEVRTIDWATAEA